MSEFPRYILLNTSPSFQEFDRPLLGYLSWYVSIARWSYIQSPDEPSYLNNVLDLLHNYLSQSEEPVNLIGHGINGLVGLLYAHQHPDRVKSLVLLSVGSYPGVDWQSVYYAHLKMLPCSRRTILTHLAYSLFGQHDRVIINGLVEKLETNLRDSPSPHSLWQQCSVPMSKPKVPLLICGGEHDVVASPREIEGWRQWLGVNDQIWQCPNGRHFFQYSHPQKVTQQVISFWLSITKEHPYVVTYPKATG